MQPDCMGDEGSKWPLELVRSECLAKTARVIDGYQRIGDKISVNNNTHLMKIDRAAHLDLVNNSINNQ